MLKILAQFVIKVNFFNIGRLQKLFLHLKCTYIKNVIFISGNWARMDLAIRQGFKK